MARLRTHVGRARRTRLTAGGLAAALSPHPGHLRDPGFEPLYFEPKGLDPTPHGEARNPGKTVHYTPGHAPTATQNVGGGPHPSIVRTDPSTGRSTSYYVPGSSGGRGGAPFSVPPTLVSLAPPLARAFGASPALSGALGSSLAALLAPKPPTPTLARPQTLLAAWSSSPHPDPLDPLGKKTLGDVSMADLLRAEQRNRLGINRAGIITTPAGRRAVKDLRTAQQQAAASSQITGITHGEAATRFADALAKYSHLDPRFVGAWVQAEGAGETGNTGGEAGPNNWLGVGYPAHRTPFSESPYFSGTPEQAAKATADWMRGKIGGEYDYQAASSIQNIIPMAAHKGADAALAALEQSGWGTNVDSIRQNLGMISAQPANPQAIQQLTAAKHAAKDLGISTAPPSATAQRQHYLQVFGHKIAHQLELVKAGKYDQGPGSLVVGSSDLGYGHEPEIAARLKLLSAKIGEPVYIISGHRTPQHSVEVGGFADDPHTEGRAADIGIGSALRESAASIPESVYESVGLHRPYYPESAAEVNHVELLNGGTPVTGGGASSVGYTAPGGPAIGGSVPAAIGTSGFAAPTARPAPPALTALTSPLAAGPVLPTDLLGSPEQEAHGAGAHDTLLALLGEEEGVPAATRRPSWA